MAMMVKRLNDGSETWDAATGECTSAEINYLVVSPTGKAAAIAAIIADAPATYHGLDKKNVRFDGYTGDGCIEASVVYEEPADEDEYDEDDPPTVNFDCGAGTLHVTSPIEQTCVYAAPGEAPDTDAEASAIPIGWNGKPGSESEAAGVDVSIGELRETYTKVLSVTRVTSAAWKRSVAELVGKVNSGSFKGWSTGEAMFLGCSYSAPLKGATKVQVSFHFAIRLNESNARIGNISVGSKLGYEYLWAISSDKVEAGKRTPKVKKIYRAQVCRYASFSGLGL